MITIYTMPGCTGCEIVKKHLRAWDIRYNDVNLMIWQNLYPGKIWSAPILDVDNNVYEYAAISTREKLWKAVKNAKQDQQQNKKETKKKKIKLRIKKSNKKPEVFITLTGMARINVTLTRIIYGEQPVEEIMSKWSNEEKEAAMIMWRLAQHQKASELMLLAEMLKNKADTADPYRKMNRRDEL